MAIKIKLEVPYIIFDVKRKNVIDLFKICEKSCNDCLKNMTLYTIFKVIKHEFSPKSSASAFKNRCKDSISLW